MRFVVVVTRAERVICCYPDRALSPTAMLEEARQEVRGWREEAEARGDFTIQVFEPKVGDTSRLVAEGRELL